LDLDYKTQTVSDHVAKFQGDRPMDLGERVAKEKKTSLAFYKTSRYYRTGGLNSFVVFV